MKCRFFCARGTQIYTTKIKKILGKNKNGFRRNRCATLHILTIRRIFEGVRAKNFEVTLLFVDFS